MEKDISTTTSIATSTATTEATTAFFSEIVRGTNFSAEAVYFWTVTAKDDHAILSAQLTLISGTLTFVSCLAVLIIYFVYRRDAKVFNSSNHFFAFAFALALLGAVNYCAAGAIRLLSNDIALLAGYCDVSAIHVLLVVYPMLLAELGYFVSAYRRLSGAQVLVHSGAARGGAAAGANFVASISGKDVARGAALFGGGGSTRTTAGSRRVGERESGENDSDAIATSVFDDAAETSSQGNLARKQFLPSHASSSSAAGAAAVGGGYGSVHDDGTNSTAFAANNQTAQLLQEEEANDEQKLDMAISIVESGDVFFRLFMGAVLFVSTCAALFISGILHKQRRWGSRFDPTASSWCWLPVGDGTELPVNNSNSDSGSVDRDAGYLVLQIAVEFIPLVGTPIMGIASIFMLYRALGNQLPWCAKIRCFYIGSFIITFGLGVILRLKFRQATSSLFVALAEPSIGGLNALVFLASEIYPAWKQSRTRTVRNNNNNDNNSSASRRRSVVVSGTEGQLLQHPIAGVNNENDENDNNGYDDDDDHLFIEPSLAVAIEAGSFLQGCISATANLQQQTLLVHEDEERAAFLAAGATSSGNNNSPQPRSSAAVHAQAEAAARIAKRLSDFAEQRRSRATHFILICSAICIGFLDVWSFVTFGVFVTASSAANFGIVSLAVTYYSWAPDAFAKFARRDEHIFLTLLSALVPIVVALATLKIIFSSSRSRAANSSNSITIDRNHATSLLASALLIVFVTWMVSLSFFSYNWFEHRSENQATIRFLAVTGLSAYSGIICAFHRLFLTSFDLPSSPLLTGSIIDYLSSYVGVTHGSSVLLHSASEERFGLKLRRSVQASSTCGYILGAGFALVASNYETGGAFVSAASMATFVLLLSLDWICIDDAGVTINPSLNYREFEAAMQHRPGTHHAQQQHQYGALVSGGVTETGVRRKLHDAVQQQQSLLGRRASDVSLSDHNSPIVSETMASVHSQPQRLPSAIPDSRVDYHDDESARLMRRSDAGVR